jgi:outer membrane protein OmpA-like peptidoglycan-associated protein
MVQNIIALLKDQLDDNVLGKIAGVLGENKSGVTAAVGSALPSLLLGLMKKGTEPGGAESLMQTLQEGKHDGGILDNLGSVLGGGAATTNLLSSGKTLLGSIFGDKASGLGDLIASAGGISKNASSSLLGMLAPIVMGFLGKTLKSQGGFNASGLMSLLLGQKDAIKAALPSGVTNLLGVSDLDTLGRQVPGAPEPKKKTWLWIILIIICLLLIWLWRSCGTQTVQETAKKVEGQVSETWAALGKFFAKKLPNGVELNIPELGVENKLIAFIEDAGRPVDDKTWFTFDRLTFDTGKATLKPESQEQLKNIAEILKAYPKVAIKLGGYTDNTGDSKANLTLSQQRADTVMADLVKLGVDAGRLKAEGYGQEHPVADNSTEEGRAKNRRIDLRVTAK